MDYGGRQAEQRRQSKGCHSVQPWGQLDQADSSEAMSRPVGWAGSIPGDASVTGGHPALQVGDATGSQQLWVAAGEPRDRRQLGGWTFALETWESLALNCGQSSAAGPILLIYSHDGLSGR